MPNYISKPFEGKMRPMKHIRGHSKRYFSLAAIAMHSTMHRLCSLDERYRHQDRPHLYHEYKTSPPNELCS
jgi:hypothetical protein